MREIRLGWMQPPPMDFTGGALTIGNFDGVHLGHRALISKAVEAAKNNANSSHTSDVKKPVIVITFDPPPISLLNPQANKIPLTTIPQRTKKILDAGADRVVVLQTDPGLLSLSPEAFYEDVIRHHFRAKAVVEGSDFRFGRSRAGDIETLKKLCQNDAIEFHEVKQIVYDGDIVSSSRVRSLLMAGQVRLAAQLLAGEYSISGKVITGAKRGRTIGVPTANLADVETLLPAVGVYATRVKWNGQVYKAAANIGPNPTFGEDERKIEVHLIDFSGDLYGQEIEVEFVDRIRDTRPFKNVDELKAQLQNDIATAKAGL
jgi:riboflavin kinase / FMN adenylyltransferase